MKLKKLLKKRIKPIDKQIEIEERLNLIRKKGDLYDVISQKRNATPDTFLRKTIKAHTLIFSRLIYLSLVWSRRMKNAFAPVEKIKTAQDDIREYMGLPIDVFRIKNIYVREKDKTLGILYGDYHKTLDNKCVRPAIEDLLEDLKKIEDFCSKFNINDIYIDEFFLRRYLSVKFLENYERIYHSEIMQHNDSEVDSFLQIRVTLNGLKAIIAKLEENKFDNEYIYTFKDKINDQVVKDAIDTFKYNNDVDELLMMIKSRLSMHINNEGITRDRVYGKMYATYELGDSFLRVNVSDSSGSLISRNIISLYSYLEVGDFSSLEERANSVLDNQEINQMSLLYLHLLGERPKEKLDKEDIYSIYDYIYDKYKTTKHNKKIPWIKTKIQRLEAESAQFVVAFFSVALALLLAFLLKFIPNHLPINSSLLNKYNNFLDNVKSTYEESYEMEKNIIGRLKQKIEKFLPKNMQDEILGYAHSEMEIKEQGGEPKKVAEIEWFTDDERPLYFVNQYSDRAYFYHGELDFYLRDSVASFARIVDCEPLFQIKVPISKNDFEDIDEDSFFHLPLEACPVGNEYALAKIIIRDEEDEAKCITIDEEWYHDNLWDLTQEEKEIFKSMERPMAYYVYGLRENASQLSSQYSIDARDYTKDITEEEAKEAIIRGLGLDDDATDEEINERLASKDFTKYPLYTPTAQTDEIDFYEKIASLDSIDINLAAILTVMSNDDFIYTVGYKNADDDEYLLTNEGYVWAMNNDGEVIDFLEYFKDEEVASSSKEDASQNDYDDWAGNQNQEINNSSKDSKDENDEVEEKEWSEEENHKIREVLDKIRLWAKEHHVSYYVAAILAVLIINKIFGRKIKLKLQFKNAYKTLEDENLARTYAELLEFIYREECGPVDRSVNDVIELIDRQFRALDEEKIEALLMELKSVIKESDNPEPLKKAEKLLRTIPFIKANKDELNAYYKVLEKTKRRI